MRFKKKLSTVIDYLLEKIIYVDFCTNENKGDGNSTQFIVLQLPVLSVMHGSGPKGFFFKKKFLVCYLVESC